jgi:hypothetical protein
VLDKDEPPILLGKIRTKSGECTPALNGCLTNTLIYHAAAQGVKIDEVESILAGDIDFQGRLGRPRKLEMDTRKSKSHSKLSLTLQKKE